MGRGPASVLVDADGNVVGVVQDGTVYRVQVESTIADSEGTTAEVHVDGTRRALEVAQPELVAIAYRIEEQLAELLLHARSITGDEDPL
jgi:hypothetical protein